MPGIFDLIGTAWTFGRKQPALIHVAFWLLLLPMLAISLLSNIIGIIRSSPQSSSPDAATTVLSLCILALIVVFVWGIACMLMIGKRLIAAKAGRTRTSFKAVRREARAFVIPLILTSILRGIITFLWGLLLIVPGIIYAIRTIFYFVIIVDENIAYRPALQRSKELVSGHLWEVFWKTAVLALILFAPITIVTSVLRAFSSTPTALIGISILSTIFTTASTVLFLLSIIQMYGALRPATGPIMGNLQKK